MPAVVSEIKPNLPPGLSQRQKKMEMFQEPVLDSFLLTSDLLPHTSACDLIQVLLDVGVPIPVLV